jgi:hypothetical protein
MRPRWKQHVDRCTFMATFACATPVPGSWDIIDYSYIHTITCKTVTGYAAALRTCWPRTYSVSCRWFSETCSMNGLPRPCVQLMLILLRAYKINLEFRFCRHYFRGRSSVGNLGLEMNLHEQDHLFLVLPSSVWVRYTCNVCYRVPISYVLRRRSRRLSVSKSDVMDQYQPTCTCTFMCEATQKLRVLLYSRQESVPDFTFLLDMGTQRTQVGSLS